MKLSSLIPHWATPGWACLIFVVIGIVTVMFILYKNIAGAIVFGIMTISCLFVLTANYAAWKDNHARDQQ